MQRTIAQEMQAEGRRIGRNEGRKEGELHARQKTLLRQLRRRFGDVPEAIAAVVSGCRA